MIKVSDKYSIRADEYNFMVIKHGVNKKTGEPTESIEGYVKDIRHALEFIYQREAKTWVRNNDATLRECIKAFTEIANSVTEFGKLYDFPSAAGGDLTENNANEITNDEKVATPRKPKQKGRGKRKVV